MSKNFEVLLRSQRDREIFPDFPPPAAPASRSHRARSLEALAHEENVKLVQGLFLLPRDQAPQAVAFSAVEHGAGCSRTCARAASTLASQVAGSVCAVDANLRHPALHHYFQVENRQGLTEAILKSDPIRHFATQLSDGNLWLLPSGSAAGDIPTLLTSDRLRARFEELRRQFDYLLIDTPPLGLYSDALQFGQLADGILLVVGSDSTRRESARRAKESLESASVKLLGAVLNRRSFPIPESLYSRF